MDVKLGKLPPKIDARTLRFARYKTALLPTPPFSRQWGQRVKEFPLFNNSTYGDCTVAAAAHMEQVWSSFTARPWTPTTEQVLDMYWATGAQDDGRYMLDVLNYWRNNGLAGTNKIHAYAEVDPKDFVEVRQAINLFGGLYIGVWLPREMQGRDHWSVVPGMVPGSWGGHAVNLTAYTRSDLVCVTWGKRLRMSWAFFKRCCDEAYAVLTENFQPAMPGYDFASLKADLSLLS